MALQDVIRALQGAVEATVYIAPNDIGLTHTELHEVGKRLGFRQGEIDDAISNRGAFESSYASSRITLPDHLWKHLTLLFFRDQPERRNPRAFDFVVKELNLSTREFGMSLARVDRKVIIERAKFTSIDQSDVEVAVALMLLAEYLVEDNACIRFKSTSGGERPLPSSNLRQDRMIPPSPKTDREQAFPHVKDVIERRSDGRPRSVEPFGAFAECLEGLGFNQYRMWWIQTASELERIDPLLCPLSTLVLSAALVEGALTFVVSRARTVGTGVFGSSDFEKDPKTWRIDDLISGAARGGNTAILNFQTKIKAETLIRTRQRIHAGRMLTEFPAGVPDIRPEEARDSKSIAAEIVRCVVDWLNTHPPLTI